LLAMFKRVLNHNGQSLCIKYQSLIPSRKDL
jgi:hypothetical protein